MIDPEPVSLSPWQARLVGLLYLVTIAAGIFAEALVRASVIDPGSGAETARAIARYEGLYRAGEAADLVMLCAYVAITALLHVLFAPTACALSLTAAGFSLIGIAVLAVAGLFHMAPLLLLDGMPWPGIPTSEVHSLVRLSLDCHGQLYQISLIFFGLYCVIIGLLAWRSRLLPRIVGGLMIAGGVAHLLLRGLAILAPVVAPAVPGQIGMIPLLGEAAFAGWLILFGARRLSNSPADAIRPGSG